MFSACAKKLEGNIVKMNNNWNIFSSKQTYWLTRFLILRLLGLVYLAAYLSIAQQLKPLIGEKGLTPVPLFLSHTQSEMGSWGRAFLGLPSLFWFGHSDTLMLITAWIGIVMSLMVLGGFANGALLTFLWAIYLSFVQIGQDWFGHEWEFQLLETGFLAIFLVPFWDWRPFPKIAPPAQIIWLMRWLLFRIMLGAGLVSLKINPHGLDLVGLHFYYECQPLPNPLSVYFFFMPPWFHKTEAFFILTVALACPWLMLFGRRFRIIAGCAMGLIQVLMLMSGSFSFLNWLTLIPILSCFDDRFLYRFLPRRIVENSNIAIYRAQGMEANQRIAWALALIVALLSINPVLNIFTSQKMTSNFLNRLYLVNNYGFMDDFGQKRLQLVIEGTSEQVLTKETVWKAYGFKYLPGNIYQAPSFCSPYQPRLDWQMALAGSSTPAQFPWIYNLVWKLLHNDSDTLGLFAVNPFPHEAPAYIRIRLFQYQFAPLSHIKDQWWQRTELSVWLPSISTRDSQLQKLLMDKSWL